MTDREHWPGRRGYRLPAEWASHAATWLSWPHNRETWPGCFEPVEPAMVEAVRALAEAEERRKLAAANAKPMEKEFQGPKGPEPTRYGDWENKGIASDF